MALPQFQARLFFDAFERSKRDVALRMGNRHASRLLGVLELDVTAPLCDRPPAIRFKRRDHVPALHVCIDTHSRQGVNPTVANGSRAIRAASRGGKRAALRSRVTCLEPDSR